MNMEKEVLTLNIEDILPNRFQPRIKFKEENINELAESIKEHGVIQPIVVRKISDKYEIIAGERRYKASVLAGKTTIPAIVTDLDDKNSAEVALIENVQRQNLTPIEEAISYKKILDMGYISQTDLAEKLGKTQSTIANKLRLLNLDEDVQEALLNEKISERHARSLLKLKKNKQVEMLNRIINERMTVRKTDEAIQEMLQEENNAPGTSESKLNNSPQTNPISEKEISSNPEEPPREPEIEILNFDIDEDKPSSVTEETLEKTMELPEIKIEKEQSNMNNNEFNIPTSPIIEMENTNMNNNLTNVNEQPTQMSNLVEMNPIVDNQQAPSSMMNPQMDNNFNNSAFNPIEQPTTVDNSEFQNSLLSENNQPQPMNISQSMQMPIEENSSTEQSSGGKFFNMFNMNNQGVDEIENQQVNMNFNEEQTSPNPFDLQFNNNANIENNVNEQNNIQPTSPDNGFMNFQNLAQSQESTMNNNLLNSQNDISQSGNNNPMNNSNNMPGMSEDPFENKLNPYSLNDDQQFTNINEISNSVNNNVPNQVQPNSSTSIENSFINPTPVSNQNVQPQGTGNLRMVINTIRDCAANIEKSGFNIDVEELDFENMYQVTFKIDKQ